MFLLLAVAILYLVVAAALYLLGRPLEYSAVFLAAGILFAAGFLVSRRSHALYRSVLRGFFVFIGAALIFAGVYFFEFPGPLQPRLRFEDSAGVWCGFVIFVGAFCIGLVALGWPRASPPSSTQERAQTRQ